MDYGLLAGIFTFFDTTGLHYGYAPLTVHSYLWHVLLIFLGVRAGFSRNADYTPSGHKKSACLYLACALIATLCNLAFHPLGNINMFYISPYYPMRQKVFLHIAAALGDGPGIALYILSVMAGAWLMHQFWSLLSRQYPS